MADVDGAGGGGDEVVALDRSHTGALNLAVLQRSDPAIEAIVASASHAAVYENRSNQEWTKKNIEGAVFVVKRTSDPRYRLVVMNRLSRSNLVQDVTATLELQTVKPPYLMFRDTARPDAGVLGVWFHDEADRRAIAATLHKIVVREARRANGSGGTGTAASSSSAAPAAAAGRALLDLVKGGGGSGAGGAAAAPPPLAPSVDALFQRGAGGGAPAPAGGAGGRHAALPPAAAAAGSGGTPLAVSDLFARASLAAAAAPPHAGAAVGSGGGDAGAVNIVLSRPQLAQALLELARDDAFLDTLHAAYLGSVARRARGGR